VPGGDGRGPLRGRGFGPGARRRRGQGAGPAGFCICPQCGTKSPHSQGMPCNTVNCPKCGNRMVRG